MGKYNNLISKNSDNNLSIYKSNISNVETSLSSIKQEADDYLEINDEFILSFYKGDNFFYNESVLLTMIDSKTKMGIAYAYCDTSMSSDSFGFVVFKEYEGKGFGHKFIKFAIDNFNLSEISVAKDNYVAQQVYFDNNFFITSQDDNLYYLKRIL